MIYPSRELFSLCPVGSSSSSSKPAEAAGSLCKHQSSITTATTTIVSNIQEANRPLTDSISLPTAVKIRWQAPDLSTITDDRSQRIHSESSGQNGLKLRVMNATSRDDGPYKCFLGSSDEKGPKETAQFNLRVYNTTNFGNTPSQVVLPVDKPGTLTCHVEFDKNVVSTEVVWLKGGKPIDMYNDSSFRVLDYDQSKQVSQLLISSVKRQHEGEYTCSASAQTPDLSKIYQHNIYLETHYAPILDSTSQTVWVERSPGAFGSMRQQMVAGQQMHSRSRSRHGKLHHPTGHVNTYPDPTDAGATAALNFNSNTTGTQTPSAIRVELRCVCQANPPASIVWTSTSSKFVLEKGQQNSPQVLEGPKSEVDGHTTTSVLTISYSFEPDYQFKQENYICSASNALGSATKTFNIEQGDPPPTFNVDSISYDTSRGSKLAFSLSQSSIKAMSETVPPIDMLRVRLDNEEMRSSLAGTKHRNNIFSNLNNLQAVWPVALSSQSGLAPSSLPRNFSVDVSRLPKGNQRLFLDAHNSVGWSLNGTYLGEFYIVNSADKIGKLSLVSVVITLLAMIFSARKNPSIAIPIS